METEMETETAHNKKYKILLVEDNEIDRAAFKRLVEKSALPYDCVLADGVTEARDILERLKFDIVILDYYLGDGIAFDLLNSTKDTPVIIVTGVGDEEIAVKAMKAGAFDYLVKDVSHNYLNVMPTAIEKVIERQKAKAELEQYNLLKSEFIANVSHELRTPLTIFSDVVSNALAGVDGPISPNLRKNLEMAEKAVKRLAKIIKNFVDISEIEAGDLKLRITKFDLQAEIHKVLNRLFPLTEEKNIELKLHSSVCELFISADRSRISQVLTELVDNAIKFTQENGNISVSAQQIDNEACIQVCDDGLGIDSSEVDKIFDRFVQMKKMIGAGEHGIGLGLSIVKELVELHGGRIEILSTLGRGTTVTVFLPLEPQCVSESAKVTV